MCDLTDPRILETYTQIVEDQPTNWLILGYNDTRDVISLYSSGTEGLSEFRNHLSDEVLYGFIRMDDRFILITWVSEQVSGVRRARALVHSRSVSALLKDYHAQITASTINDLSDANIRTRLKLGDNKELSNRRSSTNLSQKRASRRISTQSPVPTSPTSPVPNGGQNFDEFVEASESLPATPPSHIDEQEEQQPIVSSPPVAEIVDNSAAVAEQQQQQQQQQREQEEAAAAEQQRLALLAKQKEEEEIKRKKAEEVEKLAIVAANEAAAAEKEAKRVAAEKEANEKRLEQERIQRENLEAQRLEEEKRALQRKLLEAEKNKDVILSGYVSVQPMTSPFWRRRYFTIKGKSMAFYRDELQSTPIVVLDLNNVTRLNSVNVDIETFVPNAFVLETKQNGSFQLFADDKKGVQTILTALQTVI